MKTIISATGNTIDAKFDLRFGRAKYFCIYNAENGESEFIENSNKDSQSGAGTKAAELAIEQGVSRVISGDFGPKAKTILEKMNVQMVIVEDNGHTINDIIDKIKWQTTINYTNKKRYNYAWIK